jgi:transient receptor potential cation channel subfamily M protein 3
MASIPENIILERIPNSIVISTDHTIAKNLTDTYGDIRFQTKVETSKYLRVDFRTPVDSVFGILFDSWRLYRPNILISITGGAKSLNIKPSLKKALKKGIVNAALSADGWLITGGSEEGIMKIVGEGVREIASTLDPEKNVILLGIANYTSVRNNESLEKRDKVIEFEP